MSNTKNSFGIDKTVGLVLLFSAIGVGAYFLLPHIEEVVASVKNILRDGLQAVFFLGALAFVLYNIFVPTFLRAMVVNGYMSAVRFMLSAFITFDPIGIMKNYIQKLTAKRVEMNDSLTKLNGSRQALKATIDENEEKRQTNIEKSLSARDLLNRQGLAEIDKMRYKGEITVMTQEAGLLDSSNQKLKPLLYTLDKLYDTIQKLYVNSEYLIRQMTNEVNAKEKMYKAYKEGSAAVQAASKIYGADGDMDKEIFDMSVEALKDDMANRIGLIDRFMENSVSQITNIDIQKGVNEQKGLKMLEQFENEQFDVIFNPELGKLPNAPEKIMVPKNTPTSSNKFGGLLEK